MSAAEVLAAHRYGQASCEGCARSYARPKIHAHHQLAMLKDAGYAVVKLPEGVDGRWSVDEDDDDFAVSAMEFRHESDLSPTPQRHPGCRISWGSMEMNLSTGHAQALALALLAVSTDRAAVSS